MEHGIQHGWGLRDILYVYLDRMVENIDHYFFNNQ